MYSLLNHVESVQIKGSYKSFKDMFCSNKSIKGFDFDYVNVKTVSDFIHICELVKIIIKFDSSYQNIFIYTMLYT